MIETCLLLCWPRKGNRCKMPVPEKFLKLLKNVEKKLMRRNDLINGLIKRGNVGGKCGVTKRMKFHL